jgi:transcriptional regulator with XRE-family HTH domain
MNTNALGLYFRTLRDRRGMSQEYVARQVDVSLKQVSNWERGVNIPNSAKLAELLYVLGGSFDDISPILRGVDADEDEVVQLAVIHAQAHTM